MTFATNGGVALRSATTDATGRATCQIALRALLARGYKATFAGDRDYLPSYANAGLL